MESRTNARDQGQGQKKKSEAQTKDRNARGQGPKTQTQVFLKTRKGLQKNFTGDLRKTRSRNTFFSQSTKF